MLINFSSIDISRRPGETSTPHNKSTCLNTETIVSTLERIIPATVGLMVFGIPTAYLIWLCWLAFSSRRWPTTTGRITRSRVVPGRRNQAYYDVHYEYRAYGQTYTGSRVRFGGALNANSADARETTRRYPVGQNVVVHYYPDKPSLATLEQKVSGLVWLWIVLGLFFVGSIGGALIGWWD